jgi:predicted transcriptional regulator of viral defense system
VLRLANVLARLAGMTESALYVVAAAQHGLVTARQCHDLGVSLALIQSRLRSGQWGSRSRGVYAVDPAATGFRSLVRAGLLALGPESAAVLTTAARLHELAGLPGDVIPMRISRPRESPRAHRPGIHVHHLTLRPEDLTLIDGIRTTTLARTVADLMRRLDRPHAVSIADSALGRDPAVADALPELLRRGAGSMRARRWLELADGRAESPLESRVRLDCLDGGVPPDELQYPVYGDHGRLLGIADMAWLRARVIAEADGVEVHSAVAPLFRDRRRQNDLANAGWRVLRFTWADTFRRGYVADTVRRALKADAATPC